MFDFVGDGCFENVGVLLAICECILCFDYEFLMLEEFLMMLSRDFFMPLTISRWSRLFFWRA
jgi:hypothetical protein